MAGVYRPDVGNEMKSESKILVVQIEKLEIYLDEKVHIINDAIIGLTLKSFKKKKTWNGR